MEPQPRWIVGLSGDEGDLQRLRSDTEGTGVRVWREDGDWVLVSGMIESLDDAIAVTREAERLVADYGVGIRNVTELVPEEEGFGTVVRSPFESVYIPARFPWGEKRK